MDSSFTYLYQRATTVSYTHLGSWLFEVDVPCSALGDNVGVPIAVLFTLIVLLGGEHLVTLGAVRAAVKKYPDLHIDVYKRQVENGIENMLNAIQAGVLTNSTKSRLEKLEAQQDVYKRQHSDGEAQKV